MNQGWFLPLAILVGYAGTRTNLRARHYLQAERKERPWWLLMAIAWVPLACWFLSQFVPKE